MSVVQYVSQAMHGTALRVTYRRRRRVGALVARQAAALISTCLRGPLEAWVEFEGSVQLLY